MISNKEWASALRGAWFKPGAKCSQSEARRTSFRHMDTYVKQLPNSFYFSKCISFYVWLPRDNDPCCGWWINDGWCPSLQQSSKEAWKGANNSASSPFLHYYFILQYVIHPIASIKLSKIQQKKQWKGTLRAAKAGYVKAPQKSSSSHPFYPLHSLEYPMSLDLDVGYRSKWRRNRWLAIKNELLHWEGTV
jgi:hypothetical protein